jgi:ribonuclease HI
MNKPKLPDSSTSALNIYTDGGARGNPGPAAVGVVIKDKGQNTIHQFSRFIGIATNNVAEYQAVIAGLQWLLSQPEKYQRLKFFLDSALVVNQLNGQWTIKSAHCCSPT